MRVRILPIALLAAMTAALQPTTVFAQQGQRVPLPRDVSARFETRDAIMARLKQGHRAILFLGATPIDRMICEEFRRTYGDSLSSRSNNIISLTKKPQYTDAQIDCNKLTSSYDNLIRADLDDDLQIGRFSGRRVLMIICQNARGQYVNKGYVIFDRLDTSSIQDKFLLFHSYYKKGPNTWTDAKRIDKPFEVLSILSDRLPPKNTACR